MSKILSKKDIALKLARKYATSELTMEDVAITYRNFKLPFVINSALVSNSIYYCIFYNMLTQDEEVTIIDKIANNRKRHCKIHPKDPNCFMRKYLKVLDDRKKYDDISYSIYLIKKYQDFLSELDFVIHFDLSSYISSDDERDYKSPRNVEAVQNDINKIKEVLKSRNIDINSCTLEINRLSHEKKIIESYYRL
ncbi:MAG: hypothetical protein IJ809_02985 [Clostridia bacterium]|nr:hypothetical protein [Clostridia bacterium]